MCIFALALGVGARYPFVLVHVRDENALRVTRPPQRDDPLFTARDAATGGTWFGYNPATGAFAALTNVRQRVASEPSAPRSRGALVVALLDEAPLGLLSASGLAAGGQLAAEYAGFNCVAGSLALGGPLVEICSNRAAVDEVLRVAEPHDCLLTVGEPPSGRTTAVSNGRLGSRWKKTDTLASRVDALVRESDALSPDALYAALLAAVCAPCGFSDAELAAAGDERDIGTSSIDPLAERTQRRHIFLETDEHGERGTRSLSVSILVVDAERVHWFYTDWMNGCEDGAAAAEPVLTARSALRVPRAPIVRLLGEHDAPAETAGATARASTGAASHAHAPLALFGTCLQARVSALVLFDASAGVALLCNEHDETRARALVARDAERVGPLPVGHWARDSFASAPGECVLAELSAHRRALSEWGAAKNVRSLAVRLAACVLLRASDGGVLVTQRMARGTFPSLWVFAGGHVDASDGSIRAAAARELAEEVGLAIAPSRLEPLAVWESWTDPGPHERPLEFAIVFFLAPFDGPSHALLDAVRADPKEVARYAVAPALWAHAIDDVAQPARPPARSARRSASTATCGSARVTVDAREWRDGAWVASELALAQLVAKDAGSDDAEELAQGHRYAWSVSRQRHSRLESELPQYEAQ